MDDTTKTQEPSPAVVAVLRDFLEDIGLSASLHDALCEADQCVSCGTERHRGHDAACAVALWRRMMLGAVEVEEQRAAAHREALLWVEAVANRNRPGAPGAGERPVISEAQAHEWLNGRLAGFRISEERSIMGNPMRPAMLVREPRYFGWDLGANDHHAHVAAHMEMLRAAGVQPGVYIQDVDHERRTITYGRDDGRTVGFMDATSTPDHLQPRIPFAGKPPRNPMVAAQQKPHMVEKRRRSR